MNKENEGSATKSGSGAGESKCKHCRGPLASGASVCPQCNRDQRWWGQLKNIATLVTVLMAGLASWQHFAARAERVKAEEAYRLTRELSIEFAKGSALLASYSGFYEVMPGKESRGHLYESTLDRSMAILAEAGINPKAVRELQVLKGVVNTYDTGRGQMLSRYSDEKFRRESGWLTQP